LQILQTTASVLGYLSDVSSASEQRTRIISELATSLGYLYALHDRAKKAESENAGFPSIRALAVPNGPLDQYKDAIERLAAKLEPVSGIKITKAVVWPFQKKEAMEILTCIERQKSNFFLAVQNDHL
jgi:hypothetical protein